MLVCGPADYRLRYVSSNAAAGLNRADDLSPGMAVADFLGEEAVHELRNAAAKAGSDAAGVVLNVQPPGCETIFDATVHTHDGQTLIELEPCVDDGRSAHAALDLTQTLIRRISRESSMQAIADVGARLVRASLGYDRVMIYRFLHNGAGRVIAEAKTPMLGSYMGQHFPASDIPAQARRLYTENTIRMIGDVHYTPIPLEPPLPPLPPGAAPIDMSFAQLRSVSPIHCEYLRNMGVAASLSISIVVDGELWGLIACHHNTPRVVSMPLRISAELFGRYFSLQISSARRRAEIIATVGARERLDMIIAELSDSGAMIQDLAPRLADIAALINSDGAGLWVRGVWHSEGLSLPEDGARALIARVGRDAGGAIWHTQALSEAAPEVEAADIAGAIAIPLSVAAKDYLFFFRREEAHDIDWAGQPAKIADGTRLTPRGSFETWREEVRGRSLPWAEADIAVAEAIRTYLRDVVLRQGEVVAEERARVEQRRRVLNDELNHRVKNIIALVKSIALQTGAGAATVAAYSAALEGRLDALALAHDQSLRGGGGDLAQVFEAESSLHQYGGETRRVTLSGPAIRLDDRAFTVLALVAHEMMTNAAKYGALSTLEGRLSVRWSVTDAGDCEILWSESGGPAVTPPSREGFGTRLIKSTLEYDLAGSAEVAYAPAGVQGDFRIPAAHVLAGTSGAPARRRASVDPDMLSGLIVMVVEDQGLIALDTERTLQQLGAGDVLLCPGVADALGKLDQVRPGLAILDFNLGVSTSEAIADALASRGVPFVFVTGYGDGVMIPPRFSGIPIARKPVSVHSLAAPIAEALQRGQVDG